MSVDYKTIDRAAREMLQRTKADGVEVVWDRLEAQQPQCGFGTLGICCRNCLQGPCRINPFGKPDRGVCGADVHTIVARNLLRSLAGGTAAHVDHAYDVLETLQEIAQGNAPDYEIKDEAKLKAVAARVGIDTDNKDSGTLAGEVAARAYETFTNISSEPMAWLKYWAPAERLETWGKLGVLPRNADREIREAMHQTTMGMDADPVNLLLAGVKQGLVDGFAGLKLTTDIQDIIFGTPKPVTTEINLGVLKRTASMWWSTAMCRCYRKKSWSGAGSWRKMPGKPGRRALMWPGSAVPATRCSCARVCRRQPISWDRNWPWLPVLWT